MMRWIVIIVCGICTLLSFYMAFLALRAGDGGVFLFSGFGLLFGIPFIASVIQVFRKRSKFLERLDEKISGEAKLQTFVPHWFMMAAVIVTGICILSAIIIPIIVK